MIGGHHIINESLMKEFAGELEKVSGVGTILAIDVFFVHKFYRNYIVSFTYAQPNYINTILPNFLKTYGSIGGVNDWKLEYKPLNSKIHLTWDSSLIFKEIPIDNLPNIDSSFESFIQFLELNNFGKFCFWNNIYQKVEDAEVNISTVVITANNNESIIDKMKNIIYENLLKKFYSLIINEFVNLNTEQLKKILQFELDKAFIDAHKHTIKNFGFEEHLSSLKSDLEKKGFVDNEKIFETMNNLSLLRDITVDFIYSKGLKKAEIARSLIYRNDIRTYSKILELIYKSQIDKTTVNFSLADATFTHPANELKDNELIDAFGLLLNLYSNARKSANGKPFTVKLETHLDGLRLYFNNHKEIPDKYISYLNGSDLQEVSPGDGIYIIRESKTRLKNIIFGISSRQMFTEVILTIKSTQ